MRRAATVSVRLVSAASYVVESAGLQREESDMPGCESPQLRRSVSWAHALSRVARFTAGGLLVAGVFLASSCADVEPPGAGGLGVTVHALNTEACAGTDGNGTPFSEVSEVTVVITGTDPRQ